MKKCPSCGRVYSDAVVQCPSCGIELRDPADVSRENVRQYSEVQTQDQKAVYSGEVIEDRVKNGAGVWKYASVVLMLLTLLFAGLYAKQVSANATLERNNRPKEWGSVSLQEELDSLNAAYAELQEKYDVKVQEYELLDDQLNYINSEMASLYSEYEKLDRIISDYDLIGKYTVSVLDVYNGTNQYEKISDEIKKQKLNCICLNWSTFDYTKSWDDVIYVDIITPDGKIFLPKSENNNHTWKLVPSDSSDEEQNWNGWFQLNTWLSGTYRVIFYQGNRAIDSYEIRVS